MSKPAGNNIKKQINNPAFYLCWFTSMTLHLPSPEMEDVCAQTCVFIRSDPGPWTYHVSTLEKWENATPAWWSSRRAPHPTCVLGWRVWNHDTGGSETDIPTQSSSSSLPSVTRVAVLLTNLLIPVRRFPEEHRKNMYRLRSLLNFLASLEN